MHMIDTGSVAKKMPQFQEGGDGGWFHEGGAGLRPTKVGADYLNMIQAELLNVLAAAEIYPDKRRTDQLAHAIKLIAGTSDGTVGGRGLGFIMIPAEETEYTLSAGRHYSLDMTSADSDIMLSLPAGQVGDRIDLTLKLSPTHNASLSQLSRQAIPLSPCNHGRTLSLWRYEQGWEQTLSQELQDITPWTAILANWSAPAHGTLIGRSFLSIDGSLLNPVLSPTGYPLFEPVASAQYGIYLDTQHSIGGYRQQLTIIDQTSVDAGIPFVFVRAARTFADAATAGWLNMMGLPPGDLFVDGFIRTSHDVLVVNLGE